jgi:hypothetical protein
VSWYELGTSDEKKAAKRTTLAPRGHKRSVRRDTHGRIKESETVGRSFTQVRRASKDRRKLEAGRKGEESRGS